MASRAGSVALAGVSLSRTASVYIHYATAVTYSNVSFWIDDPTRARAAYHVEFNPPYDFNNGSVTAATSYALSGLTVGSHTVTVAALRSNGTTFVTSATFTVV